MIRSTICGALAVIAVIGQVMQTTCSVLLEPARPGSVKVLVAAARGHDEPVGLTDRKVMVALRSVDVLYQPHAELTDSGGRAAGRTY